MYVYSIDWHNFANLFGFLLVTDRSFPITINDCDTWNEARIAISRFLYIEFRAASSINFDAVIDIIYVCMCVRYHEYSDYERYMENRMWGISIYSRLLNRTVWNILDPRVLCSILKTAIVYGCICIAFISSRTTETFNGVKG